MALRPWLPRSTARALIGSLRLYRCLVHFVIMGCGRVGSTLANSLSKLEHDVAIIDSEPAAFRRLGSEFEGRTVTGIGFDRDTLIAAGIRGAYAVSYPHLTLP